MTTKTPEADLAAMLALLQDMSGKLDRQAQELDELRAKVATADGALPKFVPMQQPEYPNTPNGVMATLGRNGQLEGVLKDMPRGQNGQPIGEQALLLRPPQYQVGQTVRINPSVARDGFPEGMTWHDRLEKFRSNGVGKITQIVHLRNDGQWRYTGRFPGIQGPSGLDVLDNELLPA